MRCGDFENDLATGAVRGESPNSSPESSERYRHQELGPNYQEDLGAGSENEMFHGAHRTKYI